MGQLAPVEDATVAAVRRFNRYWTKVIGVLDEDLYGTYTLTETRVLYELAHHDRLEVGDLRSTLSLDAGYLTRILTRFEAAGLVTRTRSDNDGRRRVVTITDRGRATMADLERRSNDVVGTLLAPLAPATRTRLVGALGDIERSFDPSGPPGGGSPGRTVTLTEPVPGDLGWVVERHGSVYHAEYGWDATFEALVARIIAEYAREHDPARERAWIARVDGERVGSILCVRRDDQTAVLRLLLVDPSARGLGVGTALVDACVDFARAAGYRRMTLWTNDVLVAARRIYQRAGFRLVGEDPGYRFGKDLVGQDWELDLG